MKIWKFLVCGMLLAGCGPQVGEGSDGGDDGGGGDAGVDAGTESDMSWAIGFFHSQTSGIGQDRGLLEMYELREDGTAAYFAEDCVQGAYDFEEVSWRVVDDDHVEVFHPEGKSFEWISGIQESVILARAGDGLVHENEDWTRPTAYVEGKLCVTSRPEDGADCPNFFDVDLCEN